MGVLSFFNGRGGAKIAQPWCCLADKYGIITSKMLLEDMMNSFVNAIRNASGGN